MNALEELRDWIYKNVNTYKDEVLFNIADRIESEWMELPRDRDGEVIHIGDTVYCESYIEGFHVSEIRFSCTEDTALFDEGKYVWMRARSATHKRFDTWERIEADAGLPPRDYCERNHVEADSDGRVKAMANDLVRRCKALAGEGE